MAKSAWLLVFSLFFAAHVQGEILREDEGKIAYETWLVFTLNDARAGQMYFGAKDVVIDGEKRRQVLLKGSIKIKSAGFEILINYHHTSLEAPDGRILKFTLRRTSGGEETVVEGVPADGLFFLKTTQGDKRSVRQIEWDPMVMGGYGEEVLIKKHHRAPGSFLTFKSFDTRILKVVETTVYFRGWTVTDVLGEKRKLQAALSSSNEVGSSHYKMWLDEKGEIVKTLDSSVDIPLFTFRVPREVALDEGARLEVLTEAGRGLLFIPKPIPYPRSVEETLYRITLPKEGGKRFLVIDDKQRVEKREKGSLILRVYQTPSAGSPLIARPSTVTDLELKLFLEETEALCWKTPEIKALSRKLVGGEKDGWRAAKALEQWVFKNIKKTSFHLGAVSAKEVLEKRRGDSYGHSLLLASLARAAGIPARLVEGMIHFDDVFLLHTWTEVFLGQWLALDASNGRGAVDAMHIKLAEAPTLQGEREFDFKGIQSFIRGLGIEVLEFKRAGKVFRQNADARRGVLEEGRYTNPFFGFSFAFPEKASFSCCSKDLLPGEALIEITIEECPSKIYLSVLSTSSRFELSDLKRALIRRGTNVISWTQKKQGKFELLDLSVEKGGKKGRLAVLQDREMIYHIYQDSLSPEGEKAFKKISSTLQTEEAKEF